MTTRNRTSSAIAAAVIMLLPPAACSVDVRNDEAGGKAEVDVRSPVGSVSVRTNADPRDTGLAVYPGARLLRDDDNSPESAHVSVGGPWFGVNVVAATFESDDALQKIVDFYREEMAKHGEVMVCRGEVDFRGDGPDCREDRSSREVQLVVGTEEHHRLVHVEPRRGGSKLAIVSVQTNHQ